MIYRLNFLAFVFYTSNKLHWATILFVLEENYILEPLSESYKWYITTTFNYICHIFLVKGLHLDNVLLAWYFQEPSEMYKKFYIVLPVMHSCSNTFYDWKYAFSPSERLFKCKKYFLCTKNHSYQSCCYCTSKSFIFSYLKKKVNSLDDFGDYIAEYCI